MSDGRYVDLNDAFCAATGYSREETLAHSAGSLGIWADQTQLRIFLQKIKRTGSIADFELPLRTKSGAVLPYLISATVMDLGGETCVVAIGRDITGIKQNESDLIAAREVMRGQIARLERTEEWLRAEILERNRAIEQREAAVAANAVAIQRLSESEAKLRKIFETSVDNITINRLSDGRYLEVNEAFVAAFDYTREEALATSSGALGVWADRARFRQFLRTLKANGRVVNWEMNARAKDGRIDPYLISAKVIELDGEECVVTIARNIRSIKQTEAELIAAREARGAQIARLEQTEEQLRAKILERTRAMEQREEALLRLANSEGKLRKIFDVSPDSISIVRMADSTITAVNESLCEMSGLTPEELIGRNTTDTGIWIEADLKKFRRLLRTEGMVRDLDTELRHKSGRLIPHLVSAVVVELGGESCVISLAHEQRPFRGSDAPVFNWAASNNTGEYRDSSFPTKFSFARLSA